MLRDTQTGLMDEREKKGGGTITAMSIFWIGDQGIFRLGLAHQPVSKELHAARMKTPSTVYTKGKLKFIKCFLLCQEFTVRETVLQTER